MMENTRNWKANNENYIINQNILTWRENFAIMFWKNKDIHSSRSLGNGNYWAISQYFRMRHLGEFPFLGSLWEKFKIWSRKPAVQVQVPCSTLGQWGLGFVGSGLPGYHAIGKGNNFLKGIGVYKPKEWDSKSAKVNKQIPDVRVRTHGPWGSARAWTLWRSLQWDAHCTLHLCLSFSLFK